MAPVKTDQADLERDFTGVYRAHLQVVGRWAARLGGLGVEADDVVQETFMEVRRLLPRFRGDEGHLRAWLYRITANVVQRHRRREWWRRFIGGSIDDYAVELTDPQPTPIERLEARAAQERVYAILEGLSEKYRTLFILFELEEMSGEEIATLTGVKLATVWVRLHRARALFVERLARLEKRTVSLENRNLTAAALVPRAATRRSGEAP